jgi:hypothetical protein
VMVLTETRKGKEEGWFKETLRGYTTWAACYLRGPRQPVIAIKNTSPFLATSHTTIDGRLVHVTLKLPLSTARNQRCVRMTQHRRRWRTNSTSILLNAERDKEQMGQKPSASLRAIGCRAVRGRPQGHSHPHKTPSTHSLYNLGLVHMETEEGRGHTPPTDRGRHS